MTTNTNVMYRGTGYMIASLRAGMWRNLLKRLHHEATVPRRLPARGLSAVAAGLLIAAVILTLLVPHMSPLHFTMDADQRSITTTDSEPLHKAGDWLTRHKYAVLTFDDGPAGSELDDQLLRVLHQHHAHALFFVICNKLDDDTIQSIIRMEREGHAIGNHSFDHLALGHVASSVLPHQIEDCSRQIAHVTGHRPRYFRPPFGMTSSEVKRVASLAGMKEMLWTTNSYDCVFKTPIRIVQQTTGTADDTSIILMHEFATTAAALDQILTNLEQRGFEFVLPDDATGTEDKA